MEPTQVICVKEYEAKSFPENYNIEVGEEAILEGYLMGDMPTIHLSDKHKSGYAHLPFVSIALSREEFGQHFEIVDNKAAKNE